jgi:hypothetical protein
MIVWTLAGAALVASLFFARDRAILARRADPAPKAN